MIKSSVVLNVVLHMVFVLFFTAAFFAYVPEEVSAQAPSATELRIRYDRARNELNSRMELWRVAQQDWDRSAAEIVDAEGDREIERREYFEAEQRLARLEEAESAAYTAEEEFVRLARIFADTLNAARIRLEDELVSLGTSAARRGEVQSLLQGIALQLDEVNAVLGISGRIQLVAAPLLRPAERDDATDLAAKASILRRMAEDQAVAIQKIQDELGLKREQLRSQQIGRDFSADRDRFGSPSVPVLGGARRGGALREPGVVASDSTQVDGIPKTLEEEINDLEKVRDRLVADREQILERAERLRQAVGGMNP